MGKVLMSGVVPKLTVPSILPTEPPEEWDFLVAYVEDDTFIAEEDMWIRVHTFGQCGNGANGVNGRDQDEGNEEGGNGGAGGNSGGYACSEMIVKKGENYPCTFTDGTAKFSELLYATAGGTPTGRTAVSTVGQGYDGNKYNLTGYKGGVGGHHVYPTSGWIWATDGANNGAKAGTYPSYNMNHENFKENALSAGAAGGGGARLPVPYEPFPYVPSSLSAYHGGNGYNTPGSRGKAGSSYPALDLTAPMLYGGGNGGAGGAGYAGEHGIGYGGYGSSGSPACIIIEKGVY